MNQEPRKVDRLEKNNHTPVVGPLGFSNRFAVNERCAADVVDWVLLFFGIELPPAEDALGAVGPIMVARYLEKKGLNVVVEASYLSFLNPRVLLNSATKGSKIRIFTKSLEKELDDISHAKIYYGSSYEFYKVTSDWTHFVAVANSDRGQIFYDGLSSLGEDFPEHAQLLNIAGRELDKKSLTKIWVWK